MYSKVFDFQITKNEYIRISKIVKELAKLSSLSEIKELFDLWENLSCRNMFGYEINPTEKIDFTSYKEFHKFVSDFSHFSNPKTKVCRMFPEACLCEESAYNKFRNDYEKDK